MLTISGSFHRCGLSSDLIINAFLYAISIDGVSFAAATATAALAITRKMTTTQKQNVVAVVVNDSLIEYTRNSNFNSISFARTCAMSVRHTLQSWELSRGKMMKKEKKQQQR